MNSIALERLNLLPKTLTLAAMIGVLIPTFAFAQSQTTTSYYGPAPAPSRLSKPVSTLNGSVSQSLNSGSSNGMRMARGQAVGDSLFSSDAMSSFATTPQNSQPAPVQQFSQSVQTQQFTQPVQTPPPQRESEFDVGKAINIGSTVLHGFNQFMNATRPPVNMPNQTLFSGATASGALPATPMQSARNLLNFARPLNRNEISLLSNYDVAVIIDRSGSMQERDCPQGLSRWDFCREQMLNLTNQTSAAFRSGITVALFSSGYEIFNNVNFGAVPQIFADNSPDGGTYLAKPLRQILGTYFARRDSAGRGAVRPLLIEVITDGEPSDKEGVVQTICEATQKMSSPGEVTIQFLQIGQEREGDRILEQLDNRLVSQDGAQYDIVHVEPFGEIVNEGLARSLVNAATRPKS